MLCLFAVPLFVFCVCVSRKKPTATPGKIQGQIATPLWAIFFLEARLRIPSRKLFTRERLSRSIRRRFIHIARSFQGAAMPFPGGSASIAGVFPGQENRVQARPRSVPISPGNRSSVPY